MLTRSALVAALIVAVVGCRPTALAQNCAGWWLLGADERLQTAEALIQPWLMDKVRDRQHLPRDTPDTEVHLAVVVSLTKNCEIERRPGLLLADLVSTLYEAN